MLLPDGIVLRPVFPQCLDVLVFGFLLSLDHSVHSVLSAHLHYLIRIMRSLDLGFRLEVAEGLFVGLPSLLKWQAWAWMRVLTAVQELW